MRRPEERNDRGNAAVSIMAGGAFVVMLLLGLTDLSLFFLARTRAQTAADAAALAAAGELLPGPGTPQVEAARFASANGARLALCDCKSHDAVTVEVAVPVRFVLLGPVAPDEVRARAKASINLRNLGGEPPRR